VESNRINALSAKGLLAEVLAGADAEALMRERNLEQVSDDGALASWVDAVLAEHPDVAAQAAENPKAINFLMGQVMQRSAGRSRPDAVRTLLRERLGIAP
jgi:aspartyl-tRNA(Asn)/glutamyl-tRNA(Gln) amidotransferase subunit B